MVKTGTVVRLEDFNGWVCRLAQGTQSLHITRRSPLKRTVCCQSGPPNYSQKQVPLLLTSVDRVGSYVRGAAIPCKLERTSLATAGVRRPLLFRSNETQKTRHGARSSFPTLSRTLRVAFHVLHKPLSQWRVVCSFLLPLSGRLCILFANGGKSRLLRTLNPESGSLRGGASTQKGTIFCF